MESTNKGFFLLKLVFQKKFKQGDLGGHRGKYVLKIRLYTVQMNFSGFEVSKLVPICNCGCGCGLEDTLRRFKET